MSQTSLCGSVRALVLFDVCEEIRLDQLRQIFGARTVERTFKHPAPEYVRFQRPPVVEPLEPLVLEGGERLDAQIKYYDYGVLSVVFELPFRGDWGTLVQLASRWIWEAEFERHAARIARQRLEPASPALVKPYGDWLSEDYFIFQVTEAPGMPAASELLSSRRTEIVQIVRGENAALSEGELNEVLQSSISYYPNDLVVVSWNGAFIYDSVAGAEMAIELLEYANSQLLEFRHYDELLTRELDAVYGSLERGAGMLGRWRLARAASRLHRLVLDVTELTEHTDNAIKFLSDMFAARLYRLAAAKVGVPDYKNLVNQKLRIADELYRFLMEQFHQGRAFVLELMVVIILIIELVFLFRGRPG